MGIRFECSCGHRLNVKVYLAGQRGICPGCGQSIQIPESPRSLSSTAATDSPAVAVAADSVKAALNRPDERRVGPRNQGKQAIASPDDEASTDSIVIQTIAAKTPPANQPASRPAPSGDSVDPPRELPQTTSNQTAVGAVWYIRPPAGGQYGPADSDTVARWIRESRIVSTSYVWCEGWSEWQRAGDVKEHLPVPLSGPPSQEPPRMETNEPAVTNEDQLAASQHKFETLRAARRRWQRLQFVAAVLLLILVVVLGGVLFWILTREPEPQSHPGGVVLYQIIVDCLAASRLS